jgi:hypothetical protein
MTLAFAQAPTAARCPSLASRAAAFVPVIVALAAVGCGPTSVTQTYGGIGSLQADGVPAPVLGHQEVRITSCAVHRSGQEWQRFAILDVGERCHLEGEWNGGALRAHAGEDCTLNISGREFELHVVDAVIRRPTLVLHDRVYGDGSSVDVQLGGEMQSEDGAAQYVVYHVRGVLSKEAGATPYCLDAAARTTSVRTRRGAPSS